MSPFNICAVVKCINCVWRGVLRYDFFVVSQSVRQGTVAPTHYNVIHDTTQLKPDHMQRLAYKLCHLYYNWPVGRTPYGRDFDAVSHLITSNINWSSFIAHAGGSGIVDMWVESSLGVCDCVSGSVYVSVL